MVISISRTYYLLISLQCQRISSVILTAGHCTECSEELQELEAEGFLVMSVALFTFYSLLMRHVPQISGRWQLEQLHKLDACTLQNKTSVTYEEVIECRKLVGESFDSDLNFILWEECRENLNCSHIPQRQLARMGERKENTR